MSMHNQSEASFERINKSTPETDSKETEIEESKSRKRCIIIVLLVCVLAAAITALILVLVFKSSGNNIPKGYNGYTVEAVPTDGKWYYEFLIKRTKNYNCPVPINSTTNPEFSDLRYRISMMNDQTFRIKVNPIKTATEDNGLDEPEDMPRWEVPDSLLGRVSDDYGMRLTWGSFKGPKQGDSAGIQTSFLSTKDRNLVFSEFYIEMGFLVDSNKIFGFGERQGTFELNPGKYTSWNDGRDNHFDSGVLGNNSYGDHPFVLCKLNDNTFAGIFFKNSNAKVLEIQHVGKDQSILNFKAIGGVLDFFTFYAEEAEDVIKAYHSVIGTPYFPPFWALGFHQSSWQYDSIAAMNTVLDGYSKANMPLESLWLDIPFMDGFKNFLVDPVKFNNIKVTSGAMHQSGKKLVTIIDAGFSADDTYTYYRQANEQKLLITSATTGGNLFGKAFPGKVAYPDFQNPKTTGYWVNALKGLYELANMDGVWLDMNEITSFCDGECPDGDSDISNYSGKYDSLPYNPAGDGYSITKKTISLDAKHFVNAGEVEDNNVEYNMHSLYGSMQAKASFQFWIDATKVQGRRPFVSSKSTFAGAGKHTTHWLGDNFSQWPYLQLSVAGILDFNMFGIPLTGADVCGFHNNYEEEMCARWMQLSVFYPLARNHYNLTDNGKDPLKPQEPFRLTGKFLDAARFAIYQRYSLLRYYYTRLFEISKNGGGTLARPLFFEFPEDEGAYKGYEHSFMMGKAIKATPVLTKEDSNSGKVKSYFPAHSRFISLNDMTTIVEGGDKGTNSTLDASWTYSLLHLNEGTIIPYQAVTPDKYFSSTVNLINDYPIKLIIFPNKNGVAKGTLYIDQNGDDMNDYNLGYYQYYGFEYSNMTIRIDNLGGTGAKGTQNTGNQVLDEILVLGLKGLTPTALYGCAYDNDLNPRSVAVTYDATKGIFSIKANGADKLLFNSIQSIQFSTDAGSSTYCMPKYTITGITNVYSNDNSNDVVTKKVVQIASANNKYLPDLQATFTLLKDNLLRIQIIDPLDKTAFLAPEETFSPDYSKITSTLDISAVLTLPKQGENFYYEVHDPKSPSTILYSTKGQGFVYSQYYKRTTATVNSDDKLFGLGERVGDFFLTEGVYTLWARDEVSPIENAKRPGNNIYGVHPVYFSKLKKSTQFFAVFDHNAGAQDYILKKVGTDWTVTQVKTSGVTDQFILFNDQLSNVVRNFQELVGKPAMIPEWGLGWHQCRYGYNNTGQANSVVENYMQNDFPLDVMWTDIDYMDMYKDFTLSTTDFKDLPGNITQWRTKYGVRYIPILDAAVAYDETNDSYKNGKTKDIFIKDPNDNKKPFIGKVWPGPAVYIDWLKAGAEAYWVSEMTKLNKTLGFSGMWIDMNEASNFCNGYCSRSQKVANSVGDKLFYTPGSRDLNIKSISIDALHSDGHTEYEVHSLYGFYMCKATSKFFTDAKQRQFVITRSTYTGVGKYVSHWLGDNFSQYQYLRYSVGGIYLFGMWGVPVAGADICGFIFDTNAQLCARWYALGAFYPFSRNHNDKASVPQEPYVDMFNVAIKDGATYTYANFIREASLKRYAVHRYQYSYTHQASTDGTVYFKPLFYSYPDDPLAYNRVESNILLGDSLKLSPVVDDVSVTSFYFPDAKARWCPLYPKYFKT